MFRTMHKSKIHRATVTDANLNYAGSITIDEELMKEADLLENEKVLIVNVNNGSRFETYVIKGAYGNHDICLNGGAARMAQKGDIVIIISFGIFDDEKLDGFVPKVVKVDDNNRIIRG